MVSETLSKRIYETFRLRRKNGTRNFQFNNIRNGPSGISFHVKRGNRNEKDYQQDVEEK